MLVGSTCPGISGDSHHPGPEVRKHMSAIGEDSNPQVSQNPPSSTPALGRSILTGLAGLAVMTNSSCCVVCVCCCVFRGKPTRKGQLRELMVISDGLDCPGAAVLAAQSTKGPPFDSSCTKSRLEISYEPNGNKLASSGV